MNNFYYVICTKINKSYHFYIPSVCDLGRMYTAVVSMKLEHLEELFPFDELLCTV
jgi:hypothetical protein